MTLLESRDDASPLILPTEPAPNRLSAIAQLVIAVVAILLVVGAVGVGTMASFTGSDDNRTPVFSTGTLVLSNTVNEADVCFSTTGPNNHNDGCDGLFDVQVRQPGDEAAADIDLANVGTIDGDLAVHGFGACVSGDAGNEDHHGTGDLCDGLLLSIQSYADAELRDLGDTDGGTCVFGGGTSEACAFDDPSATVAQFLNNYANFSDTLDMGAMENDGATSTRFLRVSVRLPDTANDNLFQGRTASFGLTWRLAN